VHIVSRPAYMLSCLPMRHRCSHTCDQTDVNLVKILERCLAVLLENVPDSISQFIDRLCFECWAWGRWDALETVNVKFRLELFLHGFH
jgi:hypothetical protein